MSATGYDENFNFPHTFFSGDYFFVYDSDNNNVVVLIHPTPYISDTPEDKILDEELVGTMGDDMMEEME